jgi:AcrR family transcriptional regulator
MNVENTPAQNDSIKNSILDVARELFAKFGYKKTTMEDIAQALGKGKSSLYYYFKNKEDIFQAVIDWESEMLFSKLRTIVSAKLPADEKMRKYVEVRMETLRDLENYHKALVDDTLAGFGFLDHLKDNSAKEEASMIKQILEEGLAVGLFQLKNSQMAAIAISVALKGLEMPLFRSNDSKSIEELKNQLNNILNILFFGLVKR